MDNTKKFNVTIYTDGACKVNSTNNGGWGCVLICDQHYKEIFGGEKDTTNNKMELSAVIEGLKRLKYPSNVTIITDSMYVKNGASKWLNNWKSNGWLTSTNSAVKNKELWQEIDKLMNIHNITFKWVKAHNGNKHNEKADQLANQGCLL